MPFGRSRNPAATDAASLLSASALDGALSTAALHKTAAALMQHVNQGRRGLALCAAASGAGVSFVTASLAMSLARSGVNTLVVDSNLHRPAMHRLLPPAAPVEAGLSEVLRGESTSRAAIMEWPPIANLSVMYAGAVSPGVQDLFDTDIFEQAVGDCLRSYDITLLDAPPANRCAETRRIAAVAGYAAVVARRNITFAEDLATIVADLRTNRVEIIGTIFNEG